MKKKESPLIKAMKQCLFGDEKEEKYRPTKNDLAKSLEDVFGYIVDKYVDQECNLEDFAQKIIDEQGNNVSIATNSYYQHLKAKNRWGHQGANLEKSYGLEGITLSVDDEVLRIRHEAIDPDKIVKFTQELQKKQIAYSNMIVYEGVPVFDIKLEKSKDMDQIITLIKESFETSESWNLIYASLERTFPGADGKTIGSLTSGILGQEDWEAKDPTRHTYSGVSFKVELPGPITSEIGAGWKVFVKSSTDLEMMRKETKYYDQASQFSLMRVITPQKLGYLEANGLGVLVTLSTEHQKEVISQADQLEYLNLRNESFNELEKRLDLPNELCKFDYLMKDMFNRAVSHSCMREFVEDPIYRQANIESFSTKDNLVDMLGRKEPDSEVLQGVVALLPFYEKMLNLVKGLEKTQDHIIHGDARQENIFFEPAGYRPQGDFGLAKRAFIELDLGKMEAGLKEGIPVNTDLYVEAYCQFREHVERYLSEKDSGRRRFKGFSESEKRDMKMNVRVIQFMNALKMACFKTWKGRTDEAKDYLKLAENTALQITSNPYLAKVA